MKTKISEMTQEELQRVYATEKGDSGEKENG